MEALGINLPGLIAQIVNFALLLFLLYRFASKPVLRMLDERSNKIRESLERAEELRRESERVQAQIEARLEEARKEGQNIIGQAAQVGEKLKEESRQEARREAETIIGRARAEIQAERDEAVAELRRQFADFTILAAEKVINRSLDKAAHKQLIEDVLAEQTDRRN